MYSPTSSAYMHCGVWPPIPLPPTRRNPGRRETGLSPPARVFRGRDCQKKYRKKRLWRPVILQHLATPKEKETACTRRSSSFMHQRCPKLTNSVQRLMLYIPRRTSSSSRCQRSLCWWAPREGLRRGGTTGVGVGCPAGPRSPSACSSRKRPSAVGFVRSPWADFRGPGSITVGDAKNREGVKK